MSKNRLERMDIFFQNRLDGYDEHMLSSIEGAEEFYQFTAARLPMEAECEVLDLGCGTGLELEEYFALNPDARVTGIDLSAAMLNALAGKFPDKNLCLINGSYFDEPFEKRKYNAVVSVESLHHFTEAQKLLLYQKLCDALTEGGYFILTDYFAESVELEKEYFENLAQLKREQKITDDAFYHYDTPLTVEHEIGVLKKAGFSDVQILQNWGATYTLRAARHSKIIFLDIDGVLNSNFWNESHQREISDGTLIDEEKVRLLALLVKRTNAGIILHSGWRFWFDSEMKPLRPEAARLAGILAEEGVWIAGVTPDLTTEEIRRTKKFSLVKADEILLWLKSHGDVSGWVVLDDLDLHNDLIERHQVKTDQAAGLTSEDAAEAEKILMGTGESQSYGEMLYSHGVLTGKCLI